MSKNRPSELTLMVSLLVLSGISFFILFLFPQLSELVGELLWLFIAIGIFDFVVAVGLLKGIRWALNLTLTVSVFSAFCAFLAFYLVGLAINLAIFYYARKPNIREYFNRCGWERRSDPGCGTQKPPPPPPPP